MSNGDPKPVYPIYDTAPATQAPEPPCATLEVIAGPTQGRSHLLASMRTTLGRAQSNDIVLADHNASRNHAVLAFEEGRYTIEDLHSVNGVLVNDARAEKAALRSGDRIQLGATRLILSVPGLEVSQAQRRLLLEKSDLLKSMDAAALDVLAEKMEPMFYPKDAVLYSQTVSLDRMFIVHAGVCAPAT
jgi:pSer/pThr/pTyr-binding forkhead associated (FHA) protein